MGEFSVRVVDEDGRAMEGVRVAVSFGMLGGVSKDWTDSSGWTTFDNDGGNYVSGEIFVNGESQGEYSTSSGESHSFTMARYG